MTYHFLGVHPSTNPRHLNLGTNKKASAFHEKTSPWGEFCSFHEFFSLFPLSLFPAQPSHLCRHPSIRTLV